jgi:hypothetical protein
MMTLTFCLGFSNQKDFTFLFQKLWKKLLIHTNKSYDLKAIKPPFRIVQSPEIPIGVAWKSKTISIPLVESLGKNFWRYYLSLSSWNTFNCSWRENRQGKNRLDRSSKFVQRRSVKFLYKGLK